MDSGDVKKDMFSESRRGDRHSGSERAENCHSRLVRPIFQEGVHLHSDLVDDLEGMREEDWSALKPIRTD